MTASVFCIVPSETRASGVVASLQEAGFSPNDASVLFKDKQTVRIFAQENTKADVAVSAGGVAAESVGNLAGFGKILIPSVGVFLAAGPLLEALGAKAAAPKAIETNPPGAAVPEAQATVARSIDAGTTRSASGGIVAALTGMGLPDVDAEFYEEKVRAGGVLVVVRAETRDEVKTARDICREYHALDIRTSEPAKSPEATAEDHRREAEQAAWN